MYSLISRNKPIHKKETPNPHICKIFLFPSSVRLPDQQCPVDRRHKKFGHHGHHTITLSLEIFKKTMKLYTDSFLAIEFSFVWSSWTSHYHTSSENIQEIITKKTRLAVDFWHGILDNAPSRFLWNLSRISEIPIILFWFCLEILTSQHHTFFDNLREKPIKTIDLPLNGFPIYLCVCSLYN